MSKQCLKQHSATFHFAARFLSARSHQTAANLYALCREIDDLADRGAPAKSARTALIELRQALRERQGAHPLAARALALRPAINIDVLIELVDGVIQDTGHVRLQSEAELLRYCYRVAGAVGLLMCDIFGAHDQRARHHAVDLGIAMQITNICRDICEDARAGRRYLPADLVGELSPATLLKPNAGQRSRIKEVTAHLLSEADMRYESGFIGLPFLPLRARLAIYIAGLCYQAIGGIIADRGYDVWLARAHTSKRQKRLIVAQAVLRFMSSRKAHKYQGRHDPALHKGLNQRPGVHWAS